MLANLPPCFSQMSTTFCAASSHKHGVRMLEATFPQCACSQPHQSLIASCIPAFEPCCICQSRCWLNQTGHHSRAGGEAPKSQPRDTQANVGSFAQRSALKEKFPVKWSDLQLSYVSLALGQETRLKMAKTFSQCVPALSKTTLDVVNSLGFEHMTPVQGAAIPLFLSHKDVCAEVGVSSACGICVENFCSLVDSCRLVRAAVKLLLL